MRLFSAARIITGIILAAALALSTSYLALAAPKTPLLQALTSSPSGTILNVQALSPYPVQDVCVLKPYQDRITGNDDRAVRVNTFLTTAAYEPDEGHFAFVFIGADKITIERVKRSAVLDMPGDVEVRLSRAKLLPQNFIAEECVNAAAGTFIKIRDGERAYAVFGSMKP